MSFEAPDARPPAHHFSAENADAYHAQHDASDDMGAAVLEGRMVERADEGARAVPEEGNVGAAEEAPSPVVQQIESVFSPPDITSAVMRGSIRLGSRLTRPEHATHMVSPHLAECNEAYKTALAEHDTAAAELISAMGNPEKIVDNQYGTIVTRESWHYEETVIEGGETVRLAHHVTVRDLQNGPQEDVPHDALRAPSVDVRTYVLHHPTHTYSMAYAGNIQRFTGTMEYDVAFESDALNHHIERPDLQVRGAQAIAGEVTNELLAEAKSEALETWVDDFMALPVPSQSVSTGQLYPDTHEKALIALCKLVCHVPGDRAAALGALGQAFNDAGYDSLSKVMSIKFDTITELTEQYGAVSERYDWLIRNAEDVYRSILRAEPNKVGLELLPRFTREIKKEAVKIERLKALAARLNTMANISHCKPANHPYR